MANPISRNITFALPSESIPKAWYNATADLPFAVPPPIHPGTRKPLEPADLAAIFPAELIAQEMSTERWIAIPDEIRDVYRLWRPTPLKRAARFEQALGTRCRIYYKDESTSPVGSHKVNTALAQAYYNKRAGIARLITETGAGQWGTALSFACSVFGLQCRVFMVKVSYDQKPFRRTMMRSGARRLSRHPRPRPKPAEGSWNVTPTARARWGSQSPRPWKRPQKTRRSNYSLGSVLHHVLLHQTVIGLEAREQLALAGEKPDYLVGCVGGGSNFGGLVLPFLPEKLNDPALTLIGVEPTACPTMTRGRYAYDFGDTASLTPLIKMHTLGHGFIPPAIHAGGLRYHGCSPLVSALIEHGLVQPRAEPQSRVFEAAILFARSEGIVAAPETAHAIATVADLARTEAADEVHRLQPERPRLARSGVVREVPGRGSCRFRAPCRGDRRITGRLARALSRPFPDRTSRALPQTRPSGSPRLPDPDLDRRSRGTAARSARRPHPGRRRRRQDRRHRRLSEGPRRRRQGRRGRGACPPRELLLRRPPRRPERT